MGMRKSKRAGTASARLDRLPAELILRITGYLSRRDAFNLATVCRSLQDAGESIVWRDALLALGYGWDDVYINHPDTSVKELYIRSWIREPEYMRRGEQVWSESVLQSPTFPRHWGEISKRVKRLETAFRSRPARIKHVRRLTVEPIPFPDRLEWVVGEVLPYIKQLDLDLFGPLQGGRALAEDLVRDFCEFLKTKEDRSAARLRRVQLKLSGYPMLAEEIVAEVLRLGPNITELSLGATPRDMAPITEIHPDLWSKVDLPSLSSLLWFWQDNRLAVLVRHLIQMAPNIEKYTYCDDFPTDTINDGDPPPRALTKTLARVRNFLRLRWIADLCYCR